MSDSGPPYAVVGCQSCSEYWIVSDPADQIATECPRCASGYLLRELRFIATAHDIDIAREQRARILADQAGEADRYAAEDDYLTLQERYSDLEGPQRGPDLPDPDLTLPQAEVMEWAVDDRDEISEYLAWAVDDHVWYKDNLLEEGLAAAATDRADSPTITWGEPATGDPRVTVIRPGQSSVTKTPVARMSNLEPGVSTLLPQVHQALVDLLATRVRQFANERVDGLSTAPEPIAADLTHRVLDSRAPDQAAVAAQAYITTLVRFALDAETTLEDLDEDERRCLTRIGTGTGPMNAGREGLLWGPVALWSELLDDPPTIRVDLDGQAWRDLANRDTGSRTLAALSILAEALDVQLRLASPGHVRDLARRYRPWLRANCGLTPSDDRSLHQQDESDERDLETTAWEVLQQWDDKDGHLRLLQTLANGPRTVKALKRDREHDLSGSSIDVYLGDLRRHGLITVEDRTTGTNRVALSDLGEAALSMIAPDGSLVAPEQATLDDVSAHLTPTLHPAVSTVECAREGRETPRPVDPEEWLAATGEASEAGYVQWLSGEEIDSWRLHSRYTTVAQQGITLVDEPVREQEDGRVCYISHLDDELLITAQWGGPLATLGRIMSALLDPRLLSTALEPDQVGAEFQDLHDGALHRVEETVGEVIRWGHQVGWFSEDEAEWANWFDRVTGLRATFLEELGEAITTEDYDRRGELMENLHGLIASATHLYFAAGVDVCFNIRFHSTANLIDDEKRKREFLTFLRKTATKQTVYKIHSGYRMTLEDRADKLKKRLPYADDLEADAPYMETTADWVVTGPSVTDLQSVIERALSAENDEVREAVQEGEEDTAQMVIPVTDGNAYGFITRLLENLVTEKSYTIDGKSRRGHDRRRLLRLLYRGLNTAEQPHRVNPFDVVDAVRSMAKSTKQYDPLRVGDLAYGLSQLPGSRLLPELPVTATRMLQVLLAADDPIGRSEIIDRAGISESSYDRHLEKLVALDIVEGVSINGRRKWVGTLEPWWCNEASGISLPEEATRETRAYLPMPTNPRQRDLIAELIYGLGLDVDDTELGWPPPDLDRYYEESRELHRWKGWLWASLVDFEEFENRASTNVAQRIVEIGEREGAPVDIQERLSIGPPSTTSEGSTQTRPTAPVSGRSKEPAADL